MTQEKLAEEIGVSRQAVSRWESGETTPDMAFLLKICNVFHVTADYLINDSIKEVEDTPIFAIAYAHGSLQLAISCLCEATFSTAAVAQYRNCVRGKRWLRNYEYSRRNIFEKK